MRVRQLDLVDLSGWRVFPARWARKLLKRSCAFVISTKTVRPIQKDATSWRCTTEISHCSKITLPSQRSFVENPRQLKKSFASWKPRRKNAAPRNRLPRAQAAFLKIPIRVRQENWLMNWD